MYAVAAPVLVSVSRLGAGGGPLVPVAAGGDPAGDALVELKDVSFGYTKDRQILSGVTLTVPRGKLVAVMGGSGCGKTTVLRLLCGQIRAGAGEFADTLRETMLHPRVGAARQPERVRIDDPALAAEVRASSTV